MIGVYFDGLPCALDVRTRYVRPRGVDPGSSRVFLPSSAFESLKARVEAGNGRDPRFEPPKSASPAPPSPSASPGVPIAEQGQRDGMPYRGDLLLVQEEASLDGAHVNRMQLMARDLFLVESRVDDSSWDPSLVELSLVDVRYFWPRYGLITKRWNVRRPDGALVPRYARDRGAKPVPLREIVQELLSALPGRLKIVRWPASADRLPPPEVHARGASPYEILRELLARYRLALDPGPDLSARVFATGEGNVGEVLEPGEPDNDDSFDPETWTGLWLAEVVADGRAYTTRPDHMVPTEIAVVGKPAVFSVWIDYLEPCLYRQVVDPVTLEPRQQIIDVSLHNLERLVRGEFDPPAIEAGKPVTPEIQARLLEWEDVALQRAGEPKTPQGLRVVPSLADFTARLAGASGPLAPADGRPPLFWLRFPFLFESPIGKASLLRELPVGPETGIAVQAIELLGAQLWRYYRVPEHLRRLLPILDRAEVSPLGKRLPPVVFACGFQPVEVLEPGTQTDHDRNRALERQYLDHIASLQAQRRSLLPTNITDVQRLLAGEADPATKARLANAAASIVRQFVKLATDVELASATAAQLEAIDKAIAETKAALNKLDDEIDPTQPIQRKLYALEQERSAELSSGGRPSNRINAAISDALDELRKAQVEFLKREAESRKARPRLKLRNLPRRPVEFTVVDAVNGIVALDELPVWVADEDQALAESTYLIPMPVAMWCGTYNDADPEFREGVPPNGFTKAMESSLGEAPDVRAFVGHVGHKIPTEGMKESVFTFTNRDLESGEAKVGPHPFVVRDQRLQLLVKLDGLDNKTPMQARALGHASPLLAGSLDRDAGKIDLIGARQILCNGRITATEVFAKVSETGGVASLVTRASFDGDAAPLPGVTGEAIEPGPVRLLFGVVLDPESEAAL